MEAQLSHRSDQIGSEQEEGLEKPSTGHAYTALPTSGLKKNGRLDRDWEMLTSHNDWPNRSRPA